MRAVFAVISTFLLASTSVAFAHGDGLSFEQQKGDILIDIGFGKELPTIGSSITYAFDLFNTAKPDKYAFEPFTQVHVRIFRGRQQLLDRTLTNNGTDVPSLTYPYKEIGDYSMTVTYERKGKEAIDASFGYRVTEVGGDPAKPLPGTSILQPGPVWATVIGLAVLLVIGRIVFLLARKKH